MKILNLKIKKSKNPLYLRIADGIKEAIKKGHIQSGEKLPSARALATELECHRHTILSSYNELVSEGWIEGGERRAYKVIDEFPDSYFKPRPAGPKIERQTVSHKIVRNPKVVQQEAGPHIKYSFQSGLPDLRLFPKDQLKASIYDSFKRPSKGLLGYTDAHGHKPLLKEIDHYLRRVRNISDRPVIVTHGSQEGIFIAAQTLISPGEVVLVERLGYPPAWEALKAAGAKLIGIPIDENGIIIKELQKLVSKYKVKLLYTTPLHQYPTTVTLPLSRRLQLYQIALDHGFPILEDDYDHEFHYRSQPLAPLASNDPAGIIIYVSTFSKVLYPSARCGFMSVPESLFSPFSKFKRIISRQNDALIQDAIARWMREGGFERHMRKMRRAYLQRRNAMVECLEKSDLEWRLPDGGMALWLDTKVNALELAKLAGRNGIHIMHEDLFSARKTNGTHLRLGYANQTPAEIKKGISELMKIRNLLI